MRQTGRTNRMLKEAINKAKTSNKPVIVIGANHQQIEDLTRRVKCTTDKETFSKIKFTTLKLLRSSELRIWRRQSPIFVDHFAAECWLDKMDRKVDQLINEIDNVLYPKNLSKSYNSIRTFNLETR